MKTKKLDLKKDGILITKAFINPDEARKLGETVLKIQPELKSGKESKKNLTYNELVAKDHPFSYQRDVSDDGMIDIFNLQKHNGDLGEKILNLATEIIQYLPSEKSWRIASCNAYINNNVLNTRSWHCDDFRDDYKGFIYLTDVSLKDGPYAYVRGSHNRRILEKINIVYAKLSKRKSSDKRFIAKSKVMILTGSAGDLIISNQRGAHRGISQEQGASRVLLSFRFLENKK